MKHIYYIGISLALLAVLLSSCKDFLNVRPKSEKLEHQLFETAQGFEDAINGVYASLQERHLYGKELWWGLTEVLAQNLDGQSEDLRALAKYDYTNNDDLHIKLSRVWTQAYQTIGYVNNVLAHLTDERKADLHLFNLYKGEMLGVRAYIHFDLLRLFAPMDMSSRGIPYQTTFSQNVHSFSSVAACYEAIIADLKEAAILLQSDEERILYPRMNTQYSKFLNYRETHFNLYAVYALLARVYWMKGDMANAGLYARKLIDSGKFPLATVTEIKDHIAGVLSPKETIFGVYSQAYLKTSIDFFYNYQTFRSYNPYSDNTGSRHQYPYTAVYSQDKEATTQDFRLEHFKTSTGIVRFLKLVDHLTIENLATEEHRRLISGINLLRIAEIYLIGAEALLETDYPRALEWFNTEIASRGLPALKEDVQLTKERIYNEYHKELFGEGQMWYNMKRLNKEIQSNAERRIIPPTEAIYTLPIPQKEFDYRAN